jgi:phage baseplate assembly protein W
MPFNPQQISPIDFDSSVAIGVNLPFSGPAVFISNYTTADATKNNLINFFLTNQGERYMNPLFGGGIKRFIFEQITTDNLDFLREDINDKISIYFPNIIVDDLTVSGNMDSNQIKISLKYSILNTTSSDTITIEL